MILRKEMLCVCLMAVCKVEGRVQDVLVWILGNRNMQCVYIKALKGFLVLGWLKTGSLTVKVKVFALTPCFCC